MKLKNKKTGEIDDFIFEVITDRIDLYRRVGHSESKNIWHYNTLAELNADWEDYEEPKHSYYLTGWGEVKEYSEEGFNINHKLEIGNYFSSKEEAEKAVEKLKAWKRLKDNGISFKVKVIDRKWYLEPKAEPQQRTFDEAHDLFKDVMVIFGGEE